jgi:hypothetical protein
MGIVVNVTPPVNEMTGEELEKVVDEDLKEFAKFFCKGLKNESLANAERAIIKTYLWWKTHEESEPSQPTTPGQGD